MSSIESSPFIDLFSSTCVEITTSLLSAILHRAGLQPFSTRRVVFFTSLTVLEYRNIIPE